MQSTRSCNTLFPCADCSTNFDLNGKKLQYQNTVVARLMSGISRVGRRAAKISRAAANIVHILIDSKLDAFQDYKSDAARKMNKTVSQYWMKYGQPCTASIEKSNYGDNEELYVFPGRKLLCPAMKTDVKDKPGCTKK